MSYRTKRGRVPLLRKMPLLRGITLIALGMLITGTGCLSPDFTITTSGEYEGTYISAEATYSGPLGFSFTQEDEAIEVEGSITIDGEYIEFKGNGTLSKNPVKLDLDVVGTDFNMHIQGEMVNGKIKGNYTFTSQRWGNDSGTVDLG